MDLIIILETNNEIRRNSSTPKPVQRTPHHHEFDVGEEKNRKENEEFVSKISERKMTSPHKLSAREAVNDTLLQPTPGHLEITLQIDNHGKSRIYAILPSATDTKNPKWTNFLASYPIFIPHQWLKPNILRDTSFYDT